MGAGPSSRKATFRMLSGGRTGSGVTAGEVLPHSAVSESRS